VGRLRAVAVAALLLAVLTGSGRQGAASDAGNLLLAEVATAPAVDPAGIVFSLALSNRGDQSVTLTQVTAVADADVDVTVLGLASCRRGCAGALGWREAAPIVARSLLHAGTVEVPPDADVAAGRADALWVVLRVAPATSSAAAELQEGCLVVRELRVRVVGGPLQPLRNRLQDFVVALDRPDAGLPGVSRNCPLL
jgi:hypothetical protein